MSEVWKPIYGYTGMYEVSHLGRIRSLTRKGSDGRLINGRILCQSIRTNGYNAVFFSRLGKQKNFLVHRLVAKAFLKNIKGKIQVNHIDGIKTNNILSNLEWCTNSENQIHALNNGLRRQGDDLPNTKVKDTQVKEIRNKYRTGKYTQQKLGEIYNIAQSHVYRIIHFKRRK